MRIPPLIRLLTQGVREIGVKDDELKPFFDELFLIHLRKMQRSDDEGSGSAGRRAPAARRPIPAPPTRRSTTRSVSAPFWARR